MRTTDLRFDELHSLSRDVYEEYFKDVPIDDDQRTDRVLTAMALEDNLLNVLSRIELRVQRGESFLGDAIDWFTLAFLSVALHRIDDDHIRDTATRFGTDVALSTFKHQDEEYMYSADRAINMAATESNAIMCYGELADAVKAGKSVKRWRTILDGREREAHNEANGLLALIDEPFEVGGQLLMYPLDTSLGATADNIANCRCIAEYL